MKTIVSAQNKRFKEWKKLLTKKGREKQAAYLLEGPHLAQEALKEHGLVQTIIIDEAIPETVESFTGETIVIPHELFMELAQTETPQGIIAVVTMKKDDFLPVKGQYLLLDGIQDPGNLGTMIRTADAFGLNGVILGKGTVDLFNQKVLRAAQGSHLHLPIYHANLDQVIMEMKANQIPVYGTSLQGEPVDTFNHHQESFALLMGNEGGGVDPEMNKTADMQLKIPMAGKAESMNVAVAAGILMFALRKPPLA